MAEEALDIFGYLKLKQDIEAPPSARVPDSKAAPRISNPVPPAPRGDDSIARAKTLSEPSDEDVAASKLFSDSYKMVKARATEDEAFGRSVIPKLQKLSGEKFYEGVLDAADNIKIEQLKKDDPNFFNEGTSAATAFLNSATFGQLSRIQGGIGQFIQDRPYEEVVAEQAERARLLQKAFPKSNLVGEVASYLIPGSPARALFVKAASLGTKAARPLITKIVGNPDLLAKIGKRIAAGEAVTSAERVAATAAGAIASGAAGAAGTGSVGAVSGFLGEGEESPFQLDRAAEKGVQQAVLGGAMGALIPIGAAGVGAGVRAGTPRIVKGARAAAQAIAKTAERVSGVESSILRTARRSPEVLRRAQSAQQIGDDLVDHLQSEYGQLPEVQMAKQLLPEMGTVDVRPVLKTLRSVRQSVDPQDTAQINSLNDWITRIENLAVSDGPGKKLIQQQRNKVAQTADGMEKQLRDSIARKRAILNSSVEITGRRASQAAERASSNALTGAVEADLSSLTKAGVERSKVLEASLRTGLEKIERFKAAELAKIRPTAAVKDIPARQMWELKETLQNSSKVAFGEKQGILGTRLKLASRQARQLLEQRAEGLRLTNESGKTYVELMRKAAEKRRVLEYVGKKLGKNAEVQRERSESFISNLFGKNKGFAEGRMAQLDSLYGTDFLGRARASHMASQVDPGGRLPILPAQTTGKSLLGTVAGAALGSVFGPGGAAAGAALGTAASSPQVASRVVGASDAISGFVRRLVANPGALERMAGRVSKSASQPGSSRIAADRAGRQAAVLRIPKEIQTLAREVQRTLVNDGPISAASTVRVIADTPYFVGLVHYFEIQDRVQRLSEARKVIEQHGGAPQTAIKPQGE